MEAITHQQLTRRCALNARIAAYVTAFFYTAIWMQCLSHGVSSWVLGILGVAGIYATISSFGVAYTVTGTAAFRRGKYKSFNR